MNHRHEFPPKSPLVFISHCDADREVAERICLAMDANGIPSWIAHRNIKPGEDIYKKVFEALEYSEVVVFIYSAETEKSRWVKMEIINAWEKNKSIIPLIIENNSPKGFFRFLTASLQGIKAFTAPLEEHIARLIAAIKDHLESHGDAA